MLRYGSLTCFVSWYGISDVKKQNSVRLRVGNLMMKMDVLACDRLNTEYRPVHAKLVDEDKGFCAKYYHVEVGATPVSKMALIAGT